MTAAQKWTKRPIFIKAPPTTVDGYVLRTLAVHPPVSSVLVHHDTLKERSAAAWILTHLPTGCAVSQSLDPEELLSVGEALAFLPGLRSRDVSAVADIVRGAYHDLVARGLWPALDIQRRGLEP